MFLKDGSLSKVYNILQSYQGSYDFEMKWENKTQKLSFSKWTVTGEFIILEDKNKKQFIYSINKTKMFSEVFGTFDLLDGETYRFYFVNTLGKQGGKDVYKSIDDYWFSKRRLDELINGNQINSINDSMKKIINEI